MAGPNLLSTLVRKLRTISTLGAEDEAAILALPTDARSIEAGRYVVREGDKPTHSCLLVDGFAMRSKLMGTGARQIVNVHVSGDMVDLQNSLLGIADHNVQSLTRITAAFIPREAIVELAFARPQVGKSLWKETLVEGSIQREWMSNVGRRDAISRIAHLLCEFAYRLNAVGIGAECNYELPMTQEQIADAVGLTPVHVNRTLRALDQQGLTVRSRRSVMISDLKRLEEVGDFRSLYLHLPDRPLR